MALAKIDIWNLALSAIGESQVLQALTDTSMSAKICALHYEPCLRAALEVYPWPWATKQAELSEPDGITIVGWAHAYALPDDCVTPIALLDDGERVGLRTETITHPWEIKLSPDGAYRLLCTDLEPTDFSVLEYIAFVDLPALYPSQFVEALQFMLASKLALSIKKDPEFNKQLLALAWNSMQQAAANAGNARVRDPEQPTPTLLARAILPLGSWPRIW